MFRLYADKNVLTLQRREPLTSGSANVYEVLFEFSSDWEGLSRIAVFKTDRESRAIPLDASRRCTIPWEVLVNASSQLFAGVYGFRDGTVVLPTVWALLGRILEGVSPGEEARPPTPELWEQELSNKGDTLDYTPAGELGLYAGDRLLSAVQVAGGGEGGVSDHRLLANRDAAAQHPITSIDGLSSALERIPGPVEAITNVELEEILK